jgi:hypothetical protein
MDPPTHEALTLGDEISLRLMDSKKVGPLRIQSTSDAAPQIPKDVSRSLSWCKDSKLGQKYGKMKVQAFRPEEEALNVCSMSLWVMMRCFCRNGGE